jgi:UDP-3-O-[3-hydroxymyristoyl] glucosamine N-acyltransferase
MKFVKPLIYSDLNKSGINVQRFVGSEANVFCERIAKRNDKSTNTLDWCGRDKPSEIIEYLNSTRANTVISKDFDSQNLTNKSVCVIIVEDPKLEFAKIFNIFSTQSQPVINSTAIIDSKAKIGKDFSCGAFTQIGDVQIGNNVFIGNNVRIFDGVEIGDNVTIGSNTVIGSEGFGYVKDANGNLLKFPHIGSVSIGDNVDIGSNVCIDRGSLLDTIIGAGTKIDNLVHLAHNVKIGVNCHIIANAMIAGSVEIGDNTWIAPSANILEHLKIGENVTIGVGSVVTKSVPPKEVWTGAPAREIKEFVAIQRFLKKATSEE